MERLEERRVETKEEWFTFHVHGFRLSAVGSPIYRHQPLATTN